jgi:hypothetical protein
MLLAKKHSSRLSDTNVGKAVELFTTAAHTTSAPYFDQVMKQLEQCFPEVHATATSHPPETWALSQKSSPSFGKSTTSGTHVFI